MSNDDDDLGPVHTYYLKPGDPSWRELMLDLGAPLDLDWHILVDVWLDRLREDVPYDLTEMISIQGGEDWRASDEKEITDAEIELFSPAYVMRIRTFLFDEKPNRDDIPLLSPLMPGVPFLETRTRRVSPGSPASASFHYAMVPPEKRQDEFARHLRWRQALSDKMGVKNSEQAQDEKIRRGRGRPPGLTFSKEVFTVKYRKGYSDLIEETVCGRRPSQEAVAAKINMTLKTFTRHLDTYKLPWPPDNTLDFDLE